jgi:Tol biopolymer transport system component
MSLSPGEHLGPYEIVSRVGAGGMGEVYRAHDARLARDVAIKILPAAFSADAERLHRFEQEARAAAGLNHPNILVVFDIGMHASSGSAQAAPYIVSELLEGETLRERINNQPLPARTAVDYAIQIAEGLAAAHDKGIVHRDLKPENIFITTDGRVKLLDFGLAKLTQTDGALANLSSMQTAQSNTLPGLVMGTVGYMSPDQLRGKTVDHRTDVFSFGAVLYEMLCGKRAFHGETTADMISSILNWEPQELTPALKEALPPLVEETVRHCLEKNPLSRFQSMRDVVFSLRASRHPSSSVRVGDAAPASRKPSIVLYAVAMLAIVVAVLVALAAKMGWLSPPGDANLSFKQLTFRRGVIEGAAFARDGQTILYSAAWDGGPFEIYSTRMDSSESRPLGIKNANILGTTSSGEMLLLLDIVRQGPFILRGTAARASLAGGAPRPLTDNSIGGSMGKQLAVVRAKDRQSSATQLEFPPGRVIYESLSWMSHPRVSADGDLVALIDHPQGGDDGNIVVFDARGKQRMLSSGWTSVQGLAWSANGREVWFTGAKTGSNRALYAVDLSSRERLVYRSAVDVQLHDIAADGRVLLTTASRRAEIRGLLKGDIQERTLSPYDWGIGAHLTADGKAASFGESGEGSRGYAGFFIRAGENVPTRLGDGVWDPNISSDLRWAAAAEYDRHGIQVLSVSSGEVRKLERGDLQRVNGSPEWMPDSRRIMFTGIRVGQSQPQTFLQNIDGGPPQPLPVVGSRLSHDGRRLILTGAGPVTVYDLMSGQKTMLPDSDNVRVVGWSPDNSAVYVVAQGPNSRDVFSISVSSGRRSLLRRIDAGDSTGIIGLAVANVAANGEAYLLNIIRTQSDLHVISGLR